MATATEIPDPIPKRSDIHKGIRTVALNRIAAFGMQLEKVNRQNRRVERLEKFAATGDIKDLNSPEEDDDMGVSIGNEIHYHYQNTETEQPAATPPVTPTPTTENQVDEAVIRVLKKLKQVRDTAKKPTPAPIPKPSPAPIMNQIVKNTVPRWLYGVIAAAVLSAGIGTPLAVLFGGSDPPAAIDTDTDTLTDVTFPE